MTMFTQAIVRQPAPSMVSGITTARLGVPDFHKALDQHHAYINALEYCGLRVIVLDADDKHPDSVFIEDVALVTPACAVLMRPGAESRSGEVGTIRPVIESLFDTVCEIESPGSVEAGDIMMVGSHYYIGLSERTNFEGARQLIAVLAHHGLTGSTVSMSEMLHLKTGLSYLENNYLLVAGEFVGQKAFSEFNNIIVANDEAYAANSVWINDKVLLPTGHPLTSEAIKQTGYEVIELDMSEFQKLDGGLSCLSLRF